LTNRTIDQPHRARLASPITTSGNKPLREIPLVNVDPEEITNALKTFKTEVAAGASVRLRRQETDQKKMAARR